MRFFYSFLLVVLVRDGMGSGAQQVISLSFVMLIFFFVNLCDHYYIPDSPGLYTSGVGSVLAFTLSFSRCCDPVYYSPTRWPASTGWRMVDYHARFSHLRSVPFALFGFLPLVLFLTFCSHLSLFRRFYTAFLLAGRYYTPYPVRYRSLSTPSSSDFAFYTCK